MSKKNEIVKLLIECDCNPESIEETVESICDATNDKEILNVGISLAISLKHMARVMHGYDEDTNLAILLELADCYNVEFE